MMRYVYHVEPTGTTGSIQVEVNPALILEGYSCGVEDHVNGPNRAKYPQG